MKKQTKIWLVTASFLVIAGLILFTTVMAEHAWDFTKLSTKKYETNTYEIKETFRNIRVDTDTADILFGWSYDGKCKVECYEEENAKHTVAVQGNTLIIKVNNNKAWYDYIGINFDTPKIMVYLPKAVPEDIQFENVEVTSITGDVNCYIPASNLLKIHTSTGDITIDRITAGTLDLCVSTGAITVSDVICQEDVHIDVSTGKTELSNMVCKNLISEGDTGDISLNNVLATGKFSIETDTGDVRFNNADANEIFMETDTGDVIGSLGTGKLFITETNTGKVIIPQGTTGGHCKISTDTGDIKITTD